MVFLEQAELDLKNITGAEFSVPVSIQSETIVIDTTCIFDETYLTVDETGATVQSTHPQIGVYIVAIDAQLDSPLSEETSNTRVTVKGKTYRISHVERDGTGYARILLKD